MKSNTQKKSSITLPAEEFLMVNRLKRQLLVKSNVEVIRRGLWLLKESTEREELRKAYQHAARVLHGGTVEELKSLDHLAGEGIE